MRISSGGGKAAKGQLMFEFVIAAVMLFAIIIYTLNYLTMTANTYHEGFLSDYLESKAMQISDILMHDPDRGIVDEWPLLSASKMAAFNQSCDDDYIGVLYNFSMIENTPYTHFNHMSVLVNDTLGNLYVDCGRSPPTNETLWKHTASTASVTRYCLAPSGNDMAVVEVRVW